VTISIDFETYCDVSVVDVGAWRYAEHPSSEILMMAWSVDGGEPELWIPGMEFPQRVIDGAESGEEFTAWNAQFEIAMWTHNLTHLCPLPTNWVCSLSVAASFGLPLALGKCAPALGIPMVKDAAGKRLIRKFSVPRKPTKKNPATRVFPEDDLDDWEKFCDYCRQDVRVENAIIESLPISRLSDFEQQVWELDQRMNARGVKIDIETVIHVQGLINEFFKITEARVADLTGGLKTSQREAILNWCASQGYPLESYTAAVLREAVADEDLPDNVREVLISRQLTGKTSLAKFSKIMETVCGDDTCKGLVQYCGAATGRFAGRLIQVHNLPRGNLKYAEVIAGYLKYITLDDCHVIFDNIADAFSSMIRPMLIPHIGRLFVTDFANIEGRVVAWIAGQTDLIKQFASGDDVYKHMAATIFGTTYEAVEDFERFVGKQAVLGCGYGMGGPKFYATCLAYGQDIGMGLAQKTVAIYRKKNNKIVKCWYGIQGMCEQAILNPGKIYEGFKVRVVFSRKKRSLIIELPSKRCLYYRDPKIEDGQITYMGFDFKRNWARVSTYGGRLVENIVQAIARDILVAAMMRVDASAFNLVTTIHDELVSDGDFDENGDPLTQEEYDCIVAEVPDWAEGCPIAVDGHNGMRYKK